MSEKRWHAYSERDSFPCKDCPERHSGCHDHCERYQAAKRDSEARKAAAHAKKVTDAQASEFLHKQYLKTKRKKLPQR